MPKLIVSIDGVVIKEVQLTKERTTMGRRPYNDVVIDNLAVSGEHASVQIVGDDVFIEDLTSTNGTYVNGKAVKKQLLRHNDNIEVGKYKIRFLHEFQTGRTADPAPRSAAAPVDMLADVAHMPLGSIKVMAGPASGRVLSLTKEVTTVGKPGVSVASITRQAGGFDARHVEGSKRATLNGQALGDEPALLQDGDVLEIDGTPMQFIAG